MTSHQLLEESLQILHSTRDPKALEAGVQRSCAFSTPKSDNQDTSPVSALNYVLGSGYQLSSRTLSSAVSPLANLLGSGDQLSSRKLSSPVSALDDLLDSGDQLSSRSLWQHGEPGSPDQQVDDMQQVEGRNQQALEDCFRRHREYGKYLKHRGLLQKEHEELAAMMFPPQQHHARDKEPSQPPSLKRPCALLDEPATQPQKVAMTQQGAMHFIPVSSTQICTGGAQEPEAAMAKQGSMQQATAQTLHTCTGDSEQSTPTQQNNAVISAPGRSKCAEESRAGAQDVPAGTLPSTGQQTDPPQDTTTVVSSSGRSNCAQESCTHAQGFPGQTLHPCTGEKSAPHQHTSPAAPAPGRFKCAEEAISQITRTRLLVEQVQQLVPALVGHVQSGGAPAQALQSRLGSKWIKTVEQAFENHHNANATLQCAVMMLLTSQDEDPWDRAKPLIATVLQQSKETQNCLESKLEDAYGAMSCVAAVPGIEDRHCTELPKADSNPAEGPTRQASDAASVMNHSTPESNKPGQTDASILTNKATLIGSREQAGHLKSSDAGPHYMPSLTCLKINLKPILSGATSSDVTSPVVPAAEANAAAARKGAAQNTSAQQGDIHGGTRKSLL